MAVKVRSSSDLSVRWWIKMEARLILATLSRVRESPDQSADGKGAENQKTDDQE